MTEFESATRHERSKTKSEKSPQLSSVRDFLSVTRHERSETKSEKSPQFSSITDFQSFTRHERSETKSENLYIGNLTCDRISKCHASRAFRD